MIILLIMSKKYKKLIEFRSYHKNMKNPKFSSAVGRTNSFWMSVGEKRRKPDLLVVALSLCKGMQFLYVPIAYLKVFHQSSAIV